MRPFLELLTAGGRHTRFRQQMDTTTVRSEARDVAHTCGVVSRGALQPEEPSIQGCPQLRALALKGNLHVLDRRLPGEIRCGVVSRGLETCESILSPVAMRMPEVLVSRTRIVVGVGVLIERTARSSGSVNEQTAGRGEARAKYLLQGHTKLGTVRHTPAKLLLFVTMKIMTNCMQAKTRMTTRAKTKMTNETNGTERAAWHTRRPRSNRHQPGTTPNHEKMCPAHRSRLHDPARGSKYAKKTRRVPFREFVAHGHHHLGFPTLQLLLAVQLSMSQILPFRHLSSEVKKPTQQSHT